MVSRFFRNHVRSAEQTWWRRILEGCGFRIIQSHRITIPESRQDESDSQSSFGRSGRRVYFLPAAAILPIMATIIVDADPIAVWGLVVAIIGIFVGLVAAIAAIYAAVYAKAAPTKGDLARVEQNTATTSVQLGNVHSHLAKMNQDLKRVEENTAETSGHLENVHTHLATMNKRMDTQHERDTLIARANRVSLRIRGSADQSKGILFSVTTQDPNVLLNRVDLYNESGNKFGSAECRTTENPLQVLVSLEEQAFNNWLAAGSMINNSAFDRSLYLRVYMKFKGVAEEVYRPMTVISSTEIPFAANPVIRLHGEV